MAALLFSGWILTSHCRKWYILCHAAKHKNSVDLLWSFWQNAVSAGSLYNLTCHMGECVCQWTSRGEGNERIHKRPTTFLKYGGKSVKSTEVLYFFKQHEVHKIRMETQDGHTKIWSHNQEKQVGLHNISTYPNCTPDSNVITRLNGHLIISYHPIRMGQLGPTAWF